MFTCNACGVSVKKNRVDKHWQTECPGCEVLSCMDCGKDFYGDEYAAHTSCVTEAEKYQGALFKGEKGGHTKGEKKQLGWMEVGVVALRLIIALSWRFCRLLEGEASYRSREASTSHYGAGHRHFGLP